MLRDEGEIASRVVNIFKREMMKGFAALRWEAVVIRWGATLDANIELVFVKSWYVLGGFTLILGDHDRDHNYIKEERKYWNQVQIVSGMMEFGARTG